MATNVTLANLRTYCRDRGEIRESYIDNPEILAMINAGIADIHRIILSIDKERLVTSALSSVADGTADYNVEADFLQLAGVDVLLESGSPSRWANVPPWDWGRRNTYENSATRQHVRYRVMASAVKLVPTPQWDETDGLRIWYIPTATQLSGDSDTWDSVGHWHEYVICKVQMMAKAKSGEDPSIFAHQLADMRRDLEATMVIDTSEPGRVRDRDREFQTEEPMLVL